MLFNAFTAQIFLFEPRVQRCFRFEIIINVLVSSSRLILIPMLWVYGHYKYCNSLTAYNVYFNASNQFRIIISSHEEFEV